MLKALTLTDSVDTPALMVISLVTSKTLSVSPVPLLTRSNSQLIVPPSTQFSQFTYVDMPHVHNIKCNHMNSYRVTCIDADE